jgi:hypothetical protein
MSEAEMTAVSDLPTFAVFNNFAAHTKNAF